MKRKDVIRNLGKPLAAALTEQEVKSRGLWDAEDADNEFYDGVFAWVRYDSQGRVMRIWFNLTAFAKKFGGKQMVAFTTGGKTYLLSQDLTQEHAALLFGARGGRSVRVQRGAVVVDGVALNFDSQTGHLRYIWLHLNGY